MKMTVLEMAQNIASAIDSDDFNSISDTVEAYQIARVIQESYDELLADLKIPSKKSLILLDGLADTDHPNYLKLPETVKKIDWFKYDYESSSIDGDYVSILYLDPFDFIQRSKQNAFGSNNPPNTAITDFSGATLNILTSSDPVYWTTFDNTYIVTDAYNSSKDSTLQQSKSLCWGENNLTFELSDNYTPILDENLFPLLLAEAKSTCFNNIKQTASAKEEQRAKRQRIGLQNDLWRANQRKPYDSCPNYGRRSGSVNPLKNGRTA